MQALQNLGTAVITVGAGNIVDTQGYLGLEIFFIGWITLATLSALAIWFLDFSHGGKYDISLSGIDNWDEEALFPGDLNRSAEEENPEITDLNYEDLSPMP